MGLLDIDKNVQAKIDPRSIARMRFEQASRLLGAELNEMVLLSWVYLWDRFMNPNEKLVLVRLLCGMDPKYRTDVLGILVHIPIQDLGKFFVRVEKYEPDRFAEVTIEVFLDWTRGTGGSLINRIAKAYGNI